MGQLFECALCENKADDEDGCAFAIDDDDNETTDLICLSCASPEEIEAFENAEFRKSLHKRVGLGFRQRSEMPTGEGK